MTRFLPRGHWSAVNLRITWVATKQFFVFTLRDIGFGNLFLLVCAYNQIITTTTGDVQTKISTEIKLKPY